MLYRDGFHLSSRIPVLAMRQQCTSVQINIMLMGNIILPFVECAELQTCVHCISWHVYRYVRIFKMADITLDDGASRSQTFSDMMCFPYPGIEMINVYYIYFCQFSDEIFSLIHIIPDPIWSHFGAMRPAGMLLLKTCRSRSQTEYVAKQNVC